MVNSINMLSRTYNKKILFTVHPRTRKRIEKEIRNILLLLSKRLEALEYFRNNYHKSNWIETWQKLLKYLAKDSNEANFELNLLNGTEAYYSERYGWTLRRTK